MSMLEAKCTRTDCGETFVPHGVDAEDLIHGNRQDGEACGGIGVIQGEWVPPGDTPQYFHGDEILTVQEIHGIEKPDCAEPQCIHHHPELMKTEDPALEHPWF